MTATPAVLETRYDPYSFAYGDTLALCPRCASDSRLQTGLCGLFKAAVLFPCMLAKHVAFLRERQYAGELRYPWQTSEDWIHRVSASINDGISQIPQYCRFSVDAIGGEFYGQFSITPRSDGLRQARILLQLPILFLSFWESRWCSTHLRSNHGSWQEHTTQLLEQWCRICSTGSTLCLMPFHPTNQETNGLLLDAHLLRSSRY